MQHGQVVELKKRAVDGSPVWAYRYRTDGPGSRRLQRGGFASERDAEEALERAFARLRRQKGVGHHAAAERARRGVPRPIRRVTGDDRQACWLLAKAVRTFGGRRLRISPQPRSDAALITRTRGWATLQV